MLMKSLPAFVSAATLLFAGSANALIVNINAMQSGEQTGGENCAIACEGALIDPVQVTLGPGSYVITDAYSPTKGFEAGALYEAGNFEAGNPRAWGWHWKLLLDDGHDGATINPSNYASYLLFDIDGLVPQDTFTTEAAGAAFGAATPPSTLVLTKTTTLDFVINDYYLPDNAGGVSLNISSGVPEPATWAIMLVGLGGLGAGLRGARGKRAICA